VKYGITSNLTADFTVNPDFSQIESDRPQIEVNQRFPLFFSELRPFFVEGAEIFAMQAPVTFVHTRTIVDPDYGAKLTGQVGPRLAGCLTANDQAPGRSTTRAIRPSTRPPRRSSAGRSSTSARSRTSAWSSRTASSSTATAASAGSRATSA
jgi:hypothetical protein